MTRPCGFRKGGSVLKKIVIALLVCLSCLLLNSSAFANVPDFFTTTSPNTIYYPLACERRDSIPVSTTKTYEIHALYSYDTICGMDGFAFSEGAGKIKASNSYGTAGQKWRFTFARDGASFFISNCATNKILTVTPFTDTVYQGEYTGGSTQQFKLISAREDSFYIESVYSGQRLSLGMELYASYYDKPAEQQFYFIETTEKLTDQDILQLINSANNSWELTTFGGLELSPEKLIVLQNAIDSIRNKGNDVGFIIIDLDTGKGISCNPDFDCHPASTIKAPFVASLAYFHPEAIETWHESMESTIRNSDNDSYDFLWMMYGSDSLEQWFALSDVDSRILFESYPRYTPRDLAKLWSTTYSFFSNHTEQAAICASWYTSSECSALYEQLGSTYEMYTKPGWEYAEYASTNDAGIIWSNGKPYLVSIMTNMPGDFESLRSFVASIQVAFEPEQTEFHFAKERP